MLKKLFLFKNSDKETLVTWKKEKHENAILQQKNGCLTKHDKFKYFNAVCGGVGGT